MKTAEQIAKEWTGPCKCHEAYTSRKLIDPNCQYHNEYDALVITLREYGEAVRQRAAGIAGVAEEGHRALKDAHERNTNRPFDHRDFGINMDVVKYSGATAATIERMELP